MKCFFTSLSLLLFLYGCQNGTCTNSNSIFDKNLPESKIYQDELIKQLKQTANSDVVYTLKEYKQKGDNTYLYVVTKSTNLCAIAVVKVVEWNEKIEDIHRTKGKGYFYSEFKNLQLDFIQDSLKTEIIYKDLEKIID
jgi:hypothetical protein